MSYEFDEKFEVFPVEWVFQNPLGKVDWDLIKEAIGGEWVRRSGQKIQAIYKDLGETLDETSEKIELKIDFEFDINNLPSDYIYTLIGLAKAADIGTVTPVTPKNQVVVAFGSKGDAPLIVGRIGVWVIDSSGVVYSEEVDLDSTEILDWWQSKDRTFTLKYIPKDAPAIPVPKLQLIDENYKGEIVRLIDFALPSGLEFDVDSIGAFNYPVAPFQEVWGSNAWIKRIQAFPTEAPESATDLYCTAEEARILSALDKVKDKTDDEMNTLQRLFVIPDIDTKFRAEGYRTPFEKDARTPPVIRTMAAILTAAYASKSVYAGVSQNESPEWVALRKEANKMFMEINNGDRELMDIDANWIQRTQPTSSDMLSTTEGEEEVFSLDNIPDYSYEGS